MSESTRPNANGHGGARDGAGRKPKPLSEELQQLFNEAWPTEKRRETIEKAILAANTGNMRAFGLLMAYAYGTPPSGDEILIQEGVSKEVEKFHAILKTRLSESAWAEVSELIEAEAE